MLNNRQSEQLARTRDKFYGIDFRYGELFDTNFVNTILIIEAPFEECLHYAVKDTEEVVLLDEEALEIFENAEISNIKH